MASWSVVGASALAIPYRYGGLIHTEEMGICRFECLLLAAKLAERIRGFFFFLLLLRGGEHPCLRRFKSGGPSESTTRARAPASCSFLSGSSRLKLRLESGYGYDPRSSRLGSREERKPACSRRAYPKRRRPLCLARGLTDAPMASLQGR